MKILIDRQARQPIYLQIRDRIHHLIHSGHLSADTQLPSIRSLAQTVKVNKLTVIEAYSVLEADGLVRAKPGAGYFVNSSVNSSTASSVTSSGQLSTVIATSTTDWAKKASHSHFNPAQEVMMPSQGKHSFPAVYYATLASHGHADVVDLSRGEPHPFGEADLRRIARRAMKSSDLFFRQTHPKGDVSLRSQISQILVQQGLDLSPDNLIVTSGSMQALSLLAEHFITPGDWVIVEAPTYHGFLSVLQQRDAQIIGIPMTPQGMNLDLLEQYLQSHRPKLIYTISTLHNPTGITTSVEHRQRLLALAENFDCLVIEDNAYDPLSFGPTPPPIKALDKSDRVIYVGTFSKTLMLGLRVGYMAITGKHNNPLTERKLLHDFHISNASQAIVKEYLASGHYRRRLKHIRTLHRERRDHMLSLLAVHLPPTVTWTVPEGGTFLWIQLPTDISVADISTAAAAQQVLLGSGAAFFPTGQGYPALRLNFSLPPEATERGIRILGNILQAAQKQ
ncbi:MAG: PLP-dependent aminotransferase family protein [Cyanobacteria bacterium J06627_28]